MANCSDRNGGHTLVPLTIPEVHEDSTSHTSSDDVPDIDLDNPVNFETREPHASLKSPTIAGDLQKETISLVINTLTESAANLNDVDGSEVNNNSGITK